jgi:hypothetical protein
VRHSALAAVDALSDIRHLTTHPIRPAWQEELGRPAVPKSSGDDEDVARASSTTRTATDPRIARARKLLPVRPTTMRSASAARAVSRISSAGLPSLATVRTSMAPATHVRAAISWVLESCRSCARLARESGGGRPTGCPVAWIGWGRFERLHHATQRTHPGRGRCQRDLHVILPVSAPATPKQTARDEARARAPDHVRGLP